MKLKAVWIRYFKLAVAILVISVILSWLFAYEWDLSEGYFSTFGTWVTILGLGVAIYQIAELESRQEVARNAETRQKMNRFMSDSAAQCVMMANDLDKIREGLTVNDISERTIHGYINILDIFLDRWERIKSQYQTLTSQDFVQCDNCVNLANALHATLVKYLENDAYKTKFKKHSVLKQIADIKRSVIHCETEFNDSRSIQSLDQ